VTFSRSNYINALVSGDIQFDLTAPDKVVHSALGEFPVKMVMGTARGLNLVLVVHPLVDSSFVERLDREGVFDRQGLGAHCLPVSDGSN